MNFQQKPNFGESMDLQKISHVHHWTYLMLLLYWSTHISLLCAFIRKVAKLVETQKFCHHRLNHLILHENLFSHSRWLIVTPGKNWEVWTLLCCNNFKKKYYKCLCFLSQNVENCQNPGLFESAVMKRRV